MNNLFPSNPPWFSSRDSDKITLKFSPIHGIGVFAIKEIPENLILDTVKPLEMPKQLFYITILFYLVCRIFNFNIFNITKYLFLNRENRKIKAVHFLPTIFIYCNDALKTELSNIKIIYENKYNVYYIVSIKNIKPDEEILLKYE